MTDEKAPKEADFAILLQRLWNAPQGAALVFNCQMGRGRTTTGMIIASLLCMKQAHPSLSIPAHAASEPVSVLLGMCQHASAWLWARACGVEMLLGWVCLWPCGWGGES